MKLYLMKKYYVLLSFTLSFINLKTYLLVMNLYCLGFIKLKKHKSNFVLKTYFNTIVFF